MAGVRIALGLEYDGSSFCGWQSQAGGGAVQDALEAALARVAGHPVRVTAAGRTDAGVHALLQVAHFDTDAKRPASAWVRGTNTHLPPGVRVLWAQPVAAEFHARFSAVSRSYHYWLVNRPVAPAVLARKAGWFHRPLDVAAMREAAAHLIGEHDFSAFRSSECQARSPIKHISHAGVCSAGDTILLDFRANAFLHHQVRNMVGALVYVGKGRTPASWIVTLMASRDRTLAPPTFAPDGLYFSGVDYDAAWGLPPCRRALEVWPWADRAGSFG